MEADEEDEEEEDEDDDEESYGSPPPPPAAAICGIGVNGNCGDGGTIALGVLMNGPVGAGCLSNLALALSRSFPISFKHLRIRSNSA